MFIQILGNRRVVGEIKVVQLCGMKEIVKGVIASLYPYDSSS